jgi:immune inhibitor A
MSKFTGVNKALALGLMLTSCSFASIAAQGIATAGSPADSGVVNKERVLYWLIKHGDVSIDDSDETKQAAVQAFLARSTNHQLKLPLIEVQAEKSRLQKAQHLTKQQSSKAKALAAQAAIDVTKTVKVLSVLIDFPDLPHNANRLTSDDTDMYYASYPASHYKNLLFSTSGFTGPKNQTLQSGYQYFQAASGNTFFFTGDVKGWYTASNNAAYYGGNDAANNDSDKAVPELVKEAVTQAVAGMSPTELAGYDIEDPYDMDSDGNTDEADGTIDHVMIFHSSIGEEAGGGVLIKDAIWSHRFFVDQTTQGYTIPGKAIKVFGYTIQPIDAATGVCTHEFGHDLGLPDEYDTGKDSDGSPVGFWSLMSGGSWVGSLAGTEPSGFSPYARTYLQARYKGKWVNEQSLSYDSLTSTGVDFTLNSAVNAEQVNQLAINIPIGNIPFKAPFAGNYQYHTGSGNLLNNALSFDVDLTAATAPLTLSFKARWNIEQDYDYMQVLVGDVPLKGNYTKLSNPKLAGIKHYISGDSSAIPTATGADNWVELTYDLSAYMGLSKRISFVYVTDEAVGDYGMAIDEIKLLDNTNTVYSDDVETVNSAVLLSGFSRIEDTIKGKDRRYLVQLRNHLGIDAGLKAKGYEPGVLLWLENHSFTDNNVIDHPGFGLIGVVDADQDIIGNASTSSTDTQIRDAAFSLFNQKAFPGDNHLVGNLLFDDSQDYSAPLKLMAGMKLDNLGITMEVISQASDSSQAVVRFKRVDTAPIEAKVLEASFTAVVVDGKVSFSSNASGGKGNLKYAWNFGVLNANSTLLKPEYTYTDSGDYSVKLTVTDEANVPVTVTVTQTVRVIIKPVASFTATKSNLVVSLQSTSTKGFGALTYAWDFGDSSVIATTAATSHAFATAGTYAVKLTVTDSLGNVHSATQNIVITAAVPVVTPAADNGGGGGSLGWLSCLALAVLGLRRKMA